MSFSLTSDMVVVRLRSKCISMRLFPPTWRSLQGGKETQMGNLWSYFSSWDGCHFYTGLIYLCGSCGSLVVLCSHRAGNTFPTQLLTNVAIKTYAFRTSLSKYSTSIVRGPTPPSVDSSRVQGTAQRGRGGSNSSSVLRLRPPQVQSLSLISCVFTT